jgi:hypothetical protein
MEGQAALLAAFEALAAADALLVFKDAALSIPRDGVYPASGIADAAANALEVWAQHRRPWELGDPAENQPNRAEGLAERPMDQHEATIRTPTNTQPAA